MNNRVTVVSAVLVVSVDIGEREGRRWRALGREREGERGREGGREGRRVGGDLASSTFFSLFYPSLLYFDGYII